MIVYLACTVLVLLGTSLWLAFRLWHAAQVAAELRSENARLRDRVGQLLARRRAGT